MVKVSFLGVARLRWGLKESWLDISAHATLQQVVDLISQGRPDELRQQLLQQAYLVIDPIGKERLLRLPKDVTGLISDGSSVTVVTPLTGG
jgi:molybdopterin converting factor small subunit